MKRILFNLLLPGFAAVGMTACSPKTMSDSEAMKWIAGYSPERISANTPIRIELTDNVRHLYPDTPLDGMLHFSPRIKGELYLVEGRTLEFVPREGALHPGREYACHVRMSELTQIDSLGDFAFTFTVAKRETQLQITSVRVDPNDIRYMRAEGAITFSEPVEASQVDAALLHCDMQGTPAHFIVEPTDEPTVFRFTLTQLKRLETETRVHLSFDAAKLGFDAPEPQTIIVPGVKEFKLLSAERHEAAQPYIELEFSSPLAADQELEGLISIDRIDRLRIERSGTNVKLFYEKNGLTDLTLRISNLLRNRDGLSLSSEVEQHFAQEVIPPAVEIPLSGTILPDNSNLTLPFRAVNLAAVDVEVVKIYTDNVMAFLQENEIDETYRLRRVGRLIYRQTVRLDKDRSLDLHTWQNFSLDLKSLFRQEREAVYNIRLSFRRAYSLYDRTETEDFPLTSGLTENDRKIWDTDNAWISRPAPDYDWKDYSWKDRDDPSKASYYMCSDRMPEYNLTASNLGLIVKRAEGDRLWTTVADLVTAAPRAGARVTAYNYQMRKIGAARTDERGFADFEVDGNPFVVTASDGISTCPAKRVVPRQVPQSQPQPPSVRCGGPGRYAPNGRPVRRVRGPNRNVLPRCDPRAPGRSGRGSRRERISGLRPRSRAIRPCGCPAR